MKCNQKQPLSWCFICAADIIAGRKFETYSFSTPIGDFVSLYSQNLLNGASIPDEMSPRHFSSRANKKLPCFYKVIFYLRGWPESNR